jgi:hypothetical protein
MLCIYHYAKSKDCTQVGSTLASKYQTKREVTETGKDLSLLQYETNFDDSINRRKWLKFKIFLCQKMSLRSTILYHHSIQQLPFSGLSG